jgi:hypothetical protein
LLTVLVENGTAAPTKKHTMLPFLVVLFLISYGLMATLVVEQDRTIAAQGSLIHDLLGDSVELSSMKIQMHNQARAAGKAKAQNQGQSKNPSSQVNPQADAGRQKSGKLQRQSPLKPPTDASDTTDERRALITI